MLIAKRKYLLRRENVFNEILKIWSEQIECVEKLNSKRLYIYICKACDVKRNANKCSHYIASVQITFKLNP